MCCSFFYPKHSVWHIVGLQETWNGPGDVHAFIHLLLPLLKPGSYLAPQEKKGSSLNTNVPHLKLTREGHNVEYPPDWGTEDG